MKQLRVVGSLVILVFVCGNASAFQEVFNAVVTQTNMDHGNQLCTITIDNPDHPITSRTARCQRGNFSWRCLHDDYRFELAQQSRNTHRPIQIRYSEFRCDDRTNNMLFLTVW